MSAPCRNCAGERWVCENHLTAPWNEAAEHGCECGAGAPCPVCCPEMANAGLIGESDKWRELAQGLHSQFDWQGCACTFNGDDCCAFARYEAYALTDRAAPKAAQQ